ncbi:GNAT family N-acetyltransferase [Rhodovastum sp. RN2-1]|uniref:GNAT family N-acetyltransferase n=1 Tax=Limobrevibacterium gyesilva TaxID=2991712 RepID=A0AA42CJG6_9PROT|nr:GNAT family N-acetyltransferase [Limobrevibacterium gyesilva]
MPITPCAASTGVEVFASLDAVPPDCAALLDAGSAAGFFATRAWWRTMQEAGLPEGAAPRFLLCRDSGAPAALLPMLALDGGRTLQSLTNPYTCLYRPVLPPGRDAAALHRAGAALGRYCRGWPAVRLDALDRDDAGLAALLAGMRSAGIVTAPFDHFGNWHEPVAGLSWAQYLHTRHGALRETIRRKLRRAGEVAHEVVADPGCLAAGIAAYEDVYARSWKVPEPYPRFNAQMMRHAAELGALRLGILRAAGQPVAAQIWIVMNGQAAVLKLAHDEAFKALSPGTLLTALMIRDLLDQEHVAELDFGRGDDPYKQLWAGQRRQRVGVLLINPRRPRGLALLARHLLGRARRWTAHRRA